MPDSAGGRELIRCLFEAWLRPFPLLNNRRLADERHDPVPERLQPPRFVEEWGHHRPSPIRSSVVPGHSPVMMSMEVPIALLADRGTSGMCSRASRRMFTTTASASLSGGV